MKKLAILVLTLFMVSGGVLAQENELSGTDAGGALTTGTDNVFIGNYAGQSVTTGGGNTMLGMYAGRNMTTGYGNIILGYIGGDGSWTEFFPEDGSNGMRDSGIIDWVSGDLSWTTWDYDGTDQYWIRIRRTQVALGTIPIEDTFKILASTDFVWDENGDININNLTAAGDVIAGSGGTITANSVEYNDANSYQIASAVFNVDTSISAIYTWLSPSDNGTEQDLSPHNLDATYVNGSDWTATDKITKGLVWALDFDATDDYLAVADASEWSFDGSTDQAFTFGMWIQVVAGADTQAVVNKFVGGGSPDREWSIFLDENEKLTFLVYDEADDKLATNKIDTGLTDDTWYFVVHTYDGTAGGSAMSDANTIWYVDTVAVAESQTNDGSYTNMVAGASGVKIGALDDGALANFFDGDMGMMFFANTELSADAVWQIYLATRGYYGE
ncbi:hypothetical protein LCGC14_1365600 [marine sediment metagenome]|uniref:LamG-like jellyroll fold domain-containing protein n=1 Tax=marine sediment metagenome TaxID=412755 RepID=A0A0F9KSV3_9ZZZZ